MSEGGIIYTKTIDPSVQDGIDNNLIIQPNYAYQKKFVFGDDWTNIRLGVFFSFTNSVTDNNLSWDSGTNDSPANYKSSGDTSVDTYNYLGLIRDTTIKYLPGDLTNIPDRMYCGCRWNRINGNLSGSFPSAAEYCLGFNGTSMNYITAIGNTTTSIGSAPKFYCDPTRWGNTTLFSDYVVMEFLINNKGTNSQSITINIYNKGGDWTDRNTTYDTSTDVSLVNLKRQINNSTIPSYTMSDVPLNDGNAALPIPDTFFWYNAFLDLRPRIHSIAVKKLS